MQAVPGSNIGSGAMQWKKFTVVETSFGAGSTFQAITLFTLAAGEIIHATKIKHSTPFTGGSISAWTMEVGTAGDADKYGSAFDTFQAASDTTFQISSVFGSEDHGGGTSILLTARSTSDNVVEATAGSVDIWVLISKAI